MRLFFLIPAMLALLAAGCISKSAADAKARTAYFAGQQEALARQAQTSGIWFVGPVRNPIIPFTADLTLSAAFLQAEYQGTTDPVQFTIIRNGHAPIIITAKQLLGGYVLPLETGDKVEIH